jgi:parvulin-like peptidyl-prolyl isomerase
MLIWKRYLPGVLVAASLASPALARAQHAPGDGHDHDGHSHAAAAPTAKPAPASQPARPAAAPKLPAGVVAQVNGQNISRAQLHSTLDTLGGQPLLGRMITSAIVEQEAKRLGVSVTDAEISKSVADLKQRVVTQSMQAGNPGTFNEIAARAGISEGFLRFSVRQDLLARKAYEKSLDKSVPAPSFEGQVRASHILIATSPQVLSSPDAKPPTDEEAKKKADALLADIKAGKTAFDKAARESSDDKGSGMAGGDLGWFSKAQMVPEFANAAFALKPGEISEPVKSQFGYHIIRLDKTAASASAADKAAFRKTQIQQMMMNPQGMSGWLADLTNRAKIVTNPAGGGSGAAAKPAKSATKR